MAATPVTVSKMFLHGQRPASAHNRAKEYDAERKKQHAGRAPRATEYPSLTTDLTGDLVGLHAYLTGLEHRLLEATVGTFMDTRAATAGHLYNVREELAARGNA